MNSTKSCTIYPKYQDRFCSARTVVSPYESSSELFPPTDAPLAGPKSGSSTALRDRSPNASRDSHRFRTPRTKGRAKRGGAPSAVDGYGVGAWMARWNLTLPGSGGVSGKGLVRGFVRFVRFVVSILTPGPPRPPREIFECFDALMAGKRLGLFDESLGGTKSGSFTALCDRSPNASRNSHRFRTPRTKGQAKRGGMAPSAVGGYGAGRGRLGETSPYRVVRQAVDILLMSGAGLLITAWAGEGQCWRRHVRRASDRGIDRLLRSGCRIRLLVQ